MCGAASWSLLAFRKPAVSRLNTAVFPIVGSNAHAETYEVLHGGHLALIIFMTSTDEKPYLKFCPSGTISWYKHQVAEGAPHYQQQQQSIFMSTAGRRPILAILNYPCFVIADSKLFLQIS